MMIRLSLAKRLGKWGEIPLLCDDSKGFGLFRSGAQAARPISKMRLFAFVLIIGILQLVTSVAQSAPLLVPSCDTNNGHFGGTVFRDYDSDGAFDGNESGFGTTGMQVKAYDASNTVVETATVANDGKYVLTSLTDTTDYRLEISGLPTYLQATAEGSNADASVRFVNTVSCNLDFGVHNPAQFCQTNPSVATTCFVNGDPDEAGAPADTIVAFDYDGSNKTAIGFKANTGTTWGVAYDSKRDQLYTSAVLRRHAGMGPAGAGGIYAISAPASVAPGIAANFYDLTDFSVSVGTVPDNTARGLDGLAPTVPNHDAPAFALIAKVGLGDLEISNDGNTLYVTNLADKKIYSIDLENPTTAPGILPDFPATTCDNGEARPWALNVHDDKLYLGVICSAEEAAGSAVDLDAYVYAYNGSSWSTVINNFALDYPREKVVNSPASPGEWTAWRDTVADFNPPNLSAFGKPTPILSDIEFDDQGNMILGFTDRTGLQFGALNWGTDSSNTTKRYQIASGGDILKATPNGDGTYTVEDITVATDEFYYEESIPGKHLETAQGGLAVLPGSSQVMTVGMDPNNIVNTGGVYWFNTLTGASEQELQLYKGRTAEGLSGKSVGLGDLALMCQSAPLEVGNRLWCDSNSDGIQTPGEAGVGAGINVTMTCGIEFATIQTDADGKYLFTDVNWVASVNTTSTAIPRDTACTIEVDYSSVSGTIAAACGFSAVSPALQNADSDSSNSPKSDLRDSDATDTGTLASISFTTGQAGENNHSLDIGFIDGVVVTSEDFGDAPDGLYATLLANNGPRHTLDSALYLGACVDDETDGQQSTIADGDDGGAASANTNGTCATVNDDEDGLTPPSITDSAVAPTVDVTVVNTTGFDATVACWIDYDGDGAFETATEGGSNTISSSGTVTITFPNVPATANADTGGSTFMRCRTASAAADVADAVGAAANGEIEDYPVTINAIPVLSLDFGDAPSADYPTLSADNGPSHALDPDLYMGACIDDEANGQPTATADGDDTGTASANTNGSCATANDDEDGLTPPSLTDGATGPSIDVAVINTTTVDAYLACWIDYSGSGFELGERTATVIVASGATTASVTLPDVPATANTDTGGSTFMRCRIASTENEIDDATGAATNGEIEDYPVTINAIPVLSLDFGDAPSADYPTLSADNGPSHVLDPDLYMGACIDDEANGQATTNADGDDTGVASANTEGSCTSSNDDEDGLTPPSLTDGETGPSIDVVVTNATTNNAYIACWVDYSGAGFEAGERSTTVVVAANATTVSVILPDVPATANADTGGSSFLRCRIASTASEIEDPTGAATNGEIEDYPVTINVISVVSLDFGDAPSVEYSTLSADNGPSHNLDPDLYLGACIDDEVNGQPTTNADGDDTGAASTDTIGTCASTNDDEDGLTPPSLTDGATGPSIDVAVTNTTATNAYLACWIDYSGTGFEVSERSSTVVVAPNATTASVTLPDVPATASADTNGSSYLRCRIASIESEIDNPTGAAANGEIEDYKLTIDTSNAGIKGVVWFDTDKDGVKDPDETGLSGWAIEIRDGSGVLVQTLITQANGAFEDLNLGTGDFTIRFLTPGGIIVKEQDITLNPGDIAFVPEPIDPAGIIYNEQTGDPIPGAQVYLANNGTPLPVACLGAGEQGQITGADGAYSFFLNPGADPACPAADTTYGIQVIPPTDYQTTVDNPPQAGVLDADNCTIDAVAGITCEVSDQTVAPITGIPPYYILIDIGVGDPGVFNNHIPLTPPNVVLPPTPATPVKPIPTLSEWGRIILVLLIGVVTLVQQGRRRKELSKI